MMKTVTRITIAIVVAVIVAGLAFYVSGALATARERDEIAEKIAELDIPDANVILYRLDPKSRHGYSTNTDSIFHGIGILGKATILDQTEASALISALATAARNKKDPPDLCFNPGFGLSVRKGEQTKDLLICFDCGQMRPFGFNANRGIPITDAPLALFIEAAHRANLPN